MWQAERVVEAAWKVPGEVRAGRRAQPLRGNLVEATWKLRAWTAAGVQAPGQKLGGQNLAKPEEKLQTLTGTTKWARGADLGEMLHIHILVR